MIEDNEEAREDVVDLPIAEEDETYVKRTLLAIDTLHLRKSRRFFSHVKISWSDCLIFDVCYLADIASKVVPNKKGIIGMSTHFYDPLGAYAVHCYSSSVMDEPLEDLLLRS